MPISRLYHPIFLLLTIGSFLSAQTTPCDRATYTEFINRGQELVEAGDYIEAFRYYSSSKDYCPQESITVDRLITQLIATIAEDQQAAEADKQAAVNAQKAAETALTKANKLISAFYFYQGRFALAYNKNKFYFIDKNGEEVKKLSRWPAATQFSDRNGYASVGYSNTKVYYLLDTLGQAFKVASRPENIDQQTRAVDFSKRQIDQFPEQLLEWEDLKVIILSNNRRGPNLVNVPARFSQLQDLQDVQMDYCSVHHLEAGCFDLPNLRQLSLKGNWLRDLPTSVGQLPNLKVLNLEDNPIIQLSAEILQKLPQLQHLNLNGTMLTQLPTSIGELSQLQWLSVKENRLKQVPENIGNLHALRGLTLGGNDLLVLPTTIGQLSELRYLSLWGNQLTSLPSLRHLTKLETLYLSDNPLPLEEINRILTELQETSIRQLYLDGLGLQALPIAITRLQALEELHLEEGDAKHPNDFSENEKNRIRTLLPTVDIHF